MKKIFAMIIALAVMGMTVAPLVQAQDMAKVKQLSDEANRIDAQAKARGGNLTAQELQRLQQIQQEIMQEMGMAGQPVPNPQSVTPQQQPQMPQQPQQATQPQQQGGPRGIQRLTYPGATAGWPAASLLHRVSLTQPNIQTPNGITASYKREGEKVIIYLSKNFDGKDLMDTSEVAYNRKNFTDAEWQAVVSQVAKSIGKNENGRGLSSTNWGMSDPSKPNTKTMQYEIFIEINRYGGEIPVNTGMGLEMPIGCITITFEPRSIDLTTGPDFG
jgi:hypothetical protein